MSILLPLNFLKQDSENAQRGKVVTPSCVRPPPPQMIVLEAVVSHDSHAEENEKHNIHIVLLCLQVLCVLFLMPLSRANFRVYESVKLYL